MLEQVDPSGRPIRLNSGTKLHVFGNNVVKFMDQIVYVFCFMNGFVTTQNFKG